MVALVSESEGQPITDRQVGKIGQIVFAVFSLGMVVGAFQFVVEGKASKEDVRAVRLELRDIKALICASTEQRQLPECQRDADDYEKAAQ
jgi:hypothetical protein